MEEGIRRQKDGILVSNHRKYGVALLYAIVTVVSLIMLFLLRDRILNGVDALFILAMPAAWLSTILSIRKLWQVKSSKSWSIPAWCIGLSLLTLSYVRAIVSIGDFLLIFHLSIIWVLNIIQQVLIIKFRNNKEGV